MTDRGSVIPAVAGITALLAAAALATTSLAVLYAAREQAVIGADAAALAAAVATFPPAGDGSAPKAVARKTADGNGTALVACHCPVDPGLGARVVSVTTAVRVSVPVFGELTVRARSRAEFDPLLWLGG